MNQDNNFNQNNFSYQGNNGMSNNQTINQNVNVNQQSQPTPSFQQPMNTFESGNVNNQSFNSKPPKKMNLGLVIGIVAAVAVVGVGIIFGSKLLSNDRNNNSGTDINENTPNKQEEEKIGTNTWGITFNGKSINFPCLLEDLTKVGISLTSDEYYDKVMENANSEFVVIFAGNENWPDEIGLSLRTKDDISKKEKNVVVTNIQIEIPRTIYGKLLTEDMLTKEQFHLKGNASIGDTKDEVISVFGNDYVVKLESDPYFNIYYEDEESELHLSFTNNILRQIQIWKKQ